jgi:DNA-binding response OmpR family regulator
LPVVVITAGGERERAKLAGLGVSVFLRKPVSYQDVVGAIRTLLGPRLGGADRPAAASPAPGGEGERRGLTDGTDVGMNPSDAMPVSRRH